MKKNYISFMLFVFLAGFSSLAIGQTSQENVTVGGKSFLKIWSADRSSYMLKPSGEIEVSQKTQKTSETPDLHLHSTGSVTAPNSGAAKLQKNQTETPSQLKLGPIAMPVMQESSAPKN